MLKTAFFTFFIAFMILITGCSVSEFVDTDMGVGDGVGEGVTCIWI